MQKRTIKNETDYLVALSYIRKELDNKNFDLDKPVSYPALLVFSIDYDANLIVADYVYPIELWG